MKLQLQKTATVVVPGASFEVPAPPANYHWSLPQLDSPRLILVNPFGCAIAGISHEGLVRFNERLHNEPAILRLLADAAERFREACSQSPEVDGDQS